MYAMSCLLLIRLNTRFDCVWSSVVFFFSSRRRHTRFDCDWSSDVCSSEIMIRHTRFDCDWSSDVCSSDLGGSIVRSPTPGMPVFVNAWVRDRQGRPVPDAEVDVWHASSEGFYENQIGRASCRERV